MDKFFKRKSIIDNEQRLKEKNCKAKEEPSKQSHTEINIEDLPADPGLRIRISEYHPNDRDKIRRAYLQKGPCQPRKYDFPQKKIGNTIRRFCPSWFNEYANWLEYSISKDAAFCLCCYPFKPDLNNQGGGDSFITEGFSNWNKKERFKIHIGGPNSSHNQALKKCYALMKQSQHIETILSKQSDQVRSMYRTRLSASINCIRFLLRQGLAFRGHDEFETSNNQDNFLELLKFLAEHNESISNVVLQNAPENHQLTAPDIQKDIVNAAAHETTNVILNEIGDDLFAIIVDESRDISNKEQMEVALRFVDKKGRVLERFLAIVHVSDTSAISLKVAIESLVCKHELSLPRIRGQGYDGASNMQGALNVLKSLILRENSSAFYIHCFAHQLQLTLVAVSKNEIQVASLFNLVSILLNIVGGSCKRVDMLREKQLAKVKDGLTKGELKSGCGLNQEICLKRPNDTRWSSHYNTLINVTIMYSSIIDVLEIIMEDGLSSEQRAEVKGLLESVQTFDFVFTLHLMKNIVGITNELSQALQRKDQDIINAMILVRISKQRLQIMRDNGWEFLLDEVYTFCKTNEIDIPDMNAIFVAKGRRCHEIQQVLNMDKYRAGLFYVVLDRQLRELDDRFNKINTELLLCVACLSPDDSFSAFDKQRLIRLAQFYPSEFSAMELIVLENQLDTYIIDMLPSDELSIIRGIAALAEKLVESKRNIVYQFVYLLVKLALILPVATATVERAFSAMKIVKNRLWNRMGDGWINDCLVTYIEKDIFDTIDNELIIQRFQSMKTRRGQL